MVTVFYEDDGSDKKKKYVLLYCDKLNSFAMFLQTDELYNKWGQSSEEKTTEIALLVELNEGEFYKALTPDRISKNNFMEGISPFLEFLNKELQDHLEKNNQSLSSTLSCCLTYQDAICDMLKTYKASTDRFASYLLEAMETKAKDSVLYNVPKNDYEFLASFKENWKNTFNKELPFDPSPIKGFNDENENEK